MTLWTIIPRDPLIFRDGRPFNADAGARAKSLPFPYPSTIAGAVRTLAGPNPLTGKFDKIRITELLSKQIRGPLLVELAESGQIADWLFPAPADALLLKHDDPIQKEKARRFLCCPLNLPNGTQTSIDKLNKESGIELKIVGLPVPTTGKPHPKAPHYWKQDAFEKWLVTPENKEVTLSDIGHNGPLAESRMHVGVNKETGTGIPGALFQTSGLEFMQREREEKEPYPKLKDVKTLGLALETDTSLDKGLGFLGGERRVAQWMKTEDVLPKCPNEVRKNILEQGACRLILLTPAYFKDGYLPTWLQEQYNIKIVGAAVPRYKVVSGWDYQIRKPKPTRRLASAGSVYFIKVKQNVENFIDAIWMRSISDGNQNRLDGFGLAVLGTWNGELQDMEVN